MKKSFGRIVLTVAACCCLVVPSGILVGCGGGSHQIIDGATACVKCHDEKDTYEVSDPAGAIQVPLTFTVKTSADSVFICTPTFISQDGSTCVPVKGVGTARSADGQASVTVEEGVYAIAIDNGDSSKYKIVVAKAGNSDATVEL